MNPYKINRIRFWFNHQCIRLDKIVTRVCIKFDREHQIQIDIPIIEN
jgi:hypothetical protein